MPARQGGARGGRARSGRDPTLPLVREDRYTRLLSQHQSRHSVGAAGTALQGGGFLGLLRRIVEGYEDAPRKGLPIGALTSQYFANDYLDGLDRHILEVLRARDHARYMDDVLWWCDTKAEARATLAEVKSHAAEARRLAVKETARINRSDRGVTFCGYRILPGARRLGRRRRRQYQRRRQHREAAYLAGLIDARTLQAAYDAVHAITLYADSLAWRRENLQRHPPVEVG